MGYNAHIACQSKSHNIFMCKCYTAFLLTYGEYSWGVQYVLSKHTPLDSGNMNTKGMYKHRIYVYST
jgi:hypothetical protein